MFMNSCFDMVFIAPKICLVSVATSTLDAEILKVEACLISNDDDYLPVLIDFLLYLLVGLYISIDYDLER